MGLGGWGPLWDAPKPWVLQRFPPHDEKPRIYVSVNEFGFITARDS